MGEWTTADQRAEYLCHHDLRERLRRFLEVVAAEPDDTTFSDYTALDRLLKVGDLRLLYQAFELKLLSKEEDIERGLELLRKEQRERVMGACR